MYEYYDWLVDKSVVAHTDWQRHLDICEECRKAIRGRFAGSSILRIYNACCEDGKPLYHAFVTDVELTEFLCDED